MESSVQFGKVKTELRVQMLQLLDKLNNPVFRRVILRRKPPLIRFQELIQLNFATVFFFIKTQLLRKPLEGLLAKTSNELEIILPHPPKNLAIKINMLRNLAEDFPHPGLFVINPL